MTFFGARDLRLGDSDHLQILGGHGTVRRKPLEPTRRAPWRLRMRNPFRYFKTSPEVIRLSVMLYVRFLPSLRTCAGSLKKVSRCGVLSLIDFVMTFSGGELVHHPACTVERTQGSKIVRRIPGREN